MSALEPNRTALGFATSIHARTAPGSIAAPRPTPRPLSQLVNRTMPIGFRLSEVELAVLEALDTDSHLSASRMAEIAGVQASDGAAWMQALTSKLLEHGIDVIAVAAGPLGEPVYMLKR